MLNLFALLEAPPRGKESHYYKHILITEVKHVCSNHTSCLVFQNTAQICIGFEFIYIQSYSLTVSKESKKIRLGKTSPVFCFTLTNKKMIHYLNNILTGREKSSLGTRYMLTFEHAPCRAKILTILNMTTAPVLMQSSVQTSEN